MSLKTRDELALRNACRKMLAEIDEALVLTPTDSYPCAPTPDRLEAWAHILREVLEVTR